MAESLRAEMVRMTQEKPDYQALSRAGRIIREGGLVAFPTETVYGLGGNALDREASRKIYAAKGRPSDNPLIVHICEMEDLYRIAAYVPPMAVKLGKRFWPGPLTMIFQKRDLVPDSTTGGQDTVAVRLPDHLLARILIREGGGFIAAPSANTSGRPSPTLAEHVAEDLGDAVDMIIDGGPVGIGLESTIVDFTEEVPKVLRPGYISLEMLRETIGEVEMDPGLIPGEGKPKAPGMKYRHYAPKADLTIVEGETEDVIATICGFAGKAREKGEQVGIMACDETAGRYPLGIVRSMGSRMREETIAAHLYQVLREFDHLGVREIYSEAFDTPRMGEAIMNRLLKAAGHRVIQAKRQEENER